MIYKLLKDLPNLNEGVLFLSSGDFYYPEIYASFSDVPDHYCYYKDVVEYLPDWFELIENG